MRFSYSSIAVLVACCLATTGVVAQVTGPITTDNGVSACVQFGSCSNGGGAATTETQKAPITSPAASVAIAGPTNAAESTASISELAATGAAAAYSSRVAHGQGSGGAPDGATAVALTATAIAGTTPSSAPSTKGKGSADVAFKLDAGFREIWTGAFAFVAIVGGALVVL